MQDLLKRLFKGTIEEILEAEMDEHLGYEKNEFIGNNSGSSRNGYNKKTIQTQMGETNVKRFLALHHEPGIRLGVAHVGDWPVSGERKLEYDTVTCSFTGDWYDAADIYREWSFKQKWFIPLHKREDIPAWLLDSPAYLTIRPQGLLDEGPVFPIDEFLPYEKCISLLEKVAEKVDAPLAVILMGWERAGSWVYPDSFPPVGGEESMKNLINLIRQHGWQAGSFCSGTRWVTDQCWNNYDGREYFKQNKGEESICRESDGSPWHENWGVEWRPSYASCLGTEQTRKNAENFVKHLMDWGRQNDTTSNCTSTTTNMGKEIF